MARTSTKKPAGGGGKQAGEVGGVQNLMDSLAVRLTQLGKRKWQVKCCMAYV